MAGEVLVASTKERGDHRGARLEEVDGGQPVVAIGSWPLGTPEHFAPRWSVSRPATG